MQDTVVKNQFMVLRALGKSFDAIARELNVRKQTLIACESSCKEEIANMKA
jgi:DNA-binding XRE family transcriptional regulator